MIAIDARLRPADLRPSLERFWALSGEKIRLVERRFDPARGAPVFTARGRYTTRGWTEWTQGFQYGSALLQFDATRDPAFLELGRRATVARMAPHLTHVGVHDHGFNNVSTYGNLLRLMNEGVLPEEPWERAFYELALKVSGAVQARRWTALPEGLGYIYSFNGPHSLFADTIRSLRALAVSWRLGHALMDEGDRKVSLLARLVTHARTTARYTVYYGEGRDAYDVRGRVAHESIFNLNDGRYRCPNSQQGFSPFTTWTRGLAWVMLGFAEELEFLAGVADAELEPLGGRADVEGCLLRAAQAASDFYLANTPTDGIPYWDTGAPRLHELGDYLGRSADPFNECEPVDSSAAAIACQGLLRLGHYLNSRFTPHASRPSRAPRRRANGTVAGQPGRPYVQAGLTVLKTLLDEPYLGASPKHEGLLLHTIYHRPNGWDYVPKGRRVPCGEACMWGDYHLREAALYAQRLANGQPYLAFWKEKPS